MKSTTFKFFLDGKEITKTQAQNMFDTTTFTIKDGGIYFTTTVTPVSKFFPADSNQMPLQKTEKIVKSLQKEANKFFIDQETKEGIKEFINKFEEKFGNYNSTRHKYNPNTDAPKFSRNVQDALRRAEEHQSQFGREKNKTSERFGDIYWGLRPTTEDEEKVFSDWERKTFDGKAYEKDKALNGGDVEEDKKNVIRELEALQRQSPSLQKFPFTNNQPNRTYPKQTEGVKETAGKLDYSEINFELFDLMAKRFSENKVKYGYGNTKKPLDLTQIEQATFRHLRKMIQPIDGDEESYLDHLSAVATNLSIILDQLKLKNSQKQEENQK